MITGAAGLRRSRTGVLLLVLGAVGSACSTGTPEAPTPTAPTPAPQALLSYNLMQTRSTTSSPNPATGPQQLRFSELERCPSTPEACLDSAPLPLVSSTTIPPGGSEYVVSRDFNATLRAGWHRMTLVVEHQPFVQTSFISFSIRLGPFSGTLPAVSAASGKLGARPQSVSMRILSSLDGNIQSSRSISGTSAGCSLSATVFPRDSQVRATATANVVFEVVDSGVACIY